jgi:hypothetical protein
MTSVGASEPVSLRMTQERDGTNGLGIIEAQTEKNDNSFDAKSPFAKTVTTVRNETTKLRYMIDLDYGKGMTELPSLYNLGSVVLKKGEGSIGLKNKGHQSYVGRFAPKRITYATRVAGAKDPSFMEYNIGAMMADIKKETTEGSRDYRKIDHTNYMLLFPCWTRNIENTFKHVSEVVKDAETLGQLEDIKADRVPTFFCTIMEFDEFPDSMEEELLECMKAFRLYYYQALLDGKSIIYVPSEGTPVRLTEEDAISPLGPSYYARLSSELSFRQIDDGLICQMTLVGYGRSLWFTDAQSIIRNRTIKLGQTLLEKPDAWDAATPMTTFTLSATCLSEEDQDRQKKPLGEALGSRFELRGLYCKFMSRITGKALWGSKAREAPSNCDDWGDARNAGGVRAELTFTDHKAAEDLVKVQAEKHRSTLKNMHLVLTRAINALVNPVIKQFSSVRPRGVTAWNMEEMYHRIAKLRWPPASAAVAAIIAPASNSSASSSKSSSTFAPSSSKPPSQPLPVTVKSVPAVPPTQPYELLLTKAGTYVQVRKGSESLTLLTYGKGPALLEWLKAMQLSVGPEKFLEWMELNAILK